MNNTVNPEKLRKAKIASCCFMGLGQILFLKQYIRGALYALVEIAMICAIVIGTKNIIPGNRKEASYFENTRPEYSEMVKYFSSDDAKDYKSDSDAILVKGIVALLIRVLSEHTPEEIINTKLYFIDEISLREHLSPTRSNGLNAMLRKMIEYANQYK